ncbi:hypothetical protein EBR21_16840, partial [bacterium]|nr:hypothetical protein [bacterium]
MRTHHRLAKAVDHVLGWNEKIIRICATPVFFWPLRTCAQSGNALADRDTLWYASNRHPAFSRDLPRGVHALSNHLLDTPWPKLLRSREALRRALDLG